MFESGDLILAKTTLHMAGSFDCHVFSSYKIVEENDQKYTQLIDARQVADNTPGVLITSRDFAFKHQTNKMHYVMMPNAIGWSHDEQIKSSQ